MLQQNGKVDGVWVTPAGSLDVLSRLEVAALRRSSQGGLYGLVRGCALAVLNCGSELDDAKQIMEQFEDFELEVVQEERGIRLHLRNAPAAAFVDGEMIQGIREHLFAVLRDVAYVQNEIIGSPGFDLGDPAGITDVIFQIARNAHLLRRGEAPDMVVCWGGHAISDSEYSYTKEVGYQLGLRGLNICTGCGPGAMKGPMKGAAVGHAKQRVSGGRYLGITEPGIIVAEPPNPIVNELVIMPDIEKRLEAFIRLGHALVVFPGGVGTLEEILFALGVLLHPDNRGMGMPLPLILTGPACCEAYFREVDGFIESALGSEARACYRVIIDDSVAVAHAVKESLQQVEVWRRQRRDAFYYNWSLALDPALQQPFSPTHEAMAALDLSTSQPSHKRVADLRRAFSGIVAGNVKEQGIRAVEAQGPFVLRGDPALMAPLDRLLRMFVEQGRMKLAAESYQPCYRILDRQPGAEAWSSD
ncbi:MAG: nucleotide 5'-monophosphate nucleosidase PpnN [Gammaproteobacteria bacterium]|nr:nucleotide 5'-monophosphate nucleosidase PpnN [Gammaproteobacteria bacterium]